MTAVAARTTPAVCPVKPICTIGITGTARAARAAGCAVAAVGTWAAATGQGQGVLTADPLFVSEWPEVDLRLQAGSPAVDAGSAAIAPADDAEGRTRDTAPDIGAYER